VKTAAELKSEVIRLNLDSSTNEAYARAGRATFEKTGRTSALQSAELHEACAKQKRARAEVLQAELSDHADNRNLIAAA
jgi:hypothetical protein